MGDAVKPLEAQFHEPVHHGQDKLDGSLRLAIDRIHTRIGKATERNMAVLDWSQCSAVERIPGKVSGAWVVRGTRMPVSAIFENLEAGANIDDILQWFDGLNREQIKALPFRSAHSLSAIPSRRRQNKAGVRYRTAICSMRLRPVVLKYWSPPTRTLLTSRICEGARSLLWSLATSSGRCCGFMFEPSWTR